MSRNSMGEGWGSFSIELLQTPKLKSALVVCLGALPKVSFKAPRALENAGLKALLPSIALSTVLLARIECVSAVAP